MKKFVWIILVSLIGLGLCTGCNLGSVSTDDVAGYVSGIQPEQAVSLATHLLALPAIQNLANAIMADSNLVATLTNAWAEVEGNYLTPDEVAAPGAAAGDTSTALPAIGSGTITGWAPVNHWWNLDDSVIESGLAYMQSRNVRWFAPEAVGNASEDVLGTPAKMDRLKSRWLLTQRICKERGIWFSPILFNDNAGDGAYQNGGMKLEKRLSQAKAFIDWVAENADKSVCSITIVSEIQTSAGSQLEAYGLSKLAGFRLDYNGGGQPSSKPAAYSGLLCYHVCDVSKWPEKNLIWMNDCGTSIRERTLNLNGDLNGLGDPAKIEAKKKEAIARGQYVFSIYGFQVNGFDKAAIDALALENATPPVPTNSVPASAADAIDISKTAMNARDSDVRGWPIRTRLSISFDTARKMMRLSYDKGSTWKTVDGCVANPWIFVEVNGVWQGATWEYLRPGVTTEKEMGCLNGEKGDHIKIGPLKGHVVKSGDRIGIMVSGLCRTTKNVQERSQIVSVVWP